MRNPLCNLRNQNSEKQHRNGRKGQRSKLLSTNPTWSSNARFATQAFRQKLVCFSMLKILVMLPPRQKLVREERRSSAWFHRIICIRKVVCIARAFVNDIWRRLSDVSWTSIRAREEGAFQHFFECSVVFCFFAGGGWRSGWMISPLPYLVSKTL